MPDFVRSSFVASCLLSFFILSAATLPPSASAADADGSSLLHLQRGHFDPVDERGVWFNGVNGTGGDSAESERSAEPVLEPARPMLLRSLARTFFGTPVDENYYLLQFTGPVRAEWKRDLGAMGVRFFDYVPQNAFIIRADSAREADIRSLEHVRWLGAYEPEFKLSRGVFDVAPEELEAGGGAVDLRVTAFAGEDAGAIRTAIESLGGVVESVSETADGVLFGVSMPVQAVRGLADVEGVKWVEPAPAHRQSNNIATGIVGARGVRDKDWSRGGTLYGEGQIVAICDSGLDTGDTGTMSRDFQDGSGRSRVVGHVTLSGAAGFDSSGHGTHVAGIIAGNGQNSGSDPASDKYPDTSFTGIAPKASIYFQAAGASDGTSRLPGIPSDLADLFSAAYTAGARVHSNSWGTSGAGNYDTESQSVDRFMWDHKDFLLVYAGGNTGYDKDLNGVVDGYSQDTPGTAKNCLTVGASESQRESGGFSTSNWGRFRTYGSPLAEDLLSDNPGGMAAFSNRGPTLDGRWKPEIVAPGTDIVSVRSSVQLGNGWGVYNDDYFFSGGTSMATPIVSGAALLIREYLMEEKGFAAPSAALVKTALIHGATSLEPGQYGDGAYREVGPPPDPAQGWGRLNLPGSVDFGTEREVRYYDVTSSAPADTDYSATYTFTVADSGAPLRATLGWTDYPGSPLVLGGLVNDLDLRVQSPDGSWRYPDNARNLSSLSKIQYATRANGVHGGPGLGAWATPPVYPSRLDGIVLAYANPKSEMGPVDVAVYSWDDGKVGSELFRKRFAYVPSGEVYVPLGVEIDSGSVFVAVENAVAGQGAYYQDGNGAGLAYELSGSSWAVASHTPAMIVLFRNQVAATDFDRINNTVSVTVENPDPGTYTVEVTAHNIPVGPQPYALVVSGLAASLETEGDASVKINPAQPDAPTMASMTMSRTDRTLNEIKAENGDSLVSVYGGVVEYSGVITGNYGQGLVSMRYPVRDLPSFRAGDLVLSKLLGGGRSLSFTYPRFEDYEDGRWWLTDASGAFVDPVRVLDPQATYYVVSTVRDNGPYDTNSTLNGVRDPQVLGVGIGGGSVSGGGGGCTVGTGPGTASPLVLTAVALGLLWMRRRR